MMIHSGLRMQALGALAALNARRYPEWKSVRKTRGAKDVSQRSRSNRRKGARRAAARD